MAVTIYTTSTCPYCIMAKQYFDSKDVSYTEKNVENDRQAATEMVEKSGQMGVPVIDFNGTVVLGFNKPHIDQLIASSAKA